jgi:hypothetical protein
MVPVVDLHGLAVEARIGGNAMVGKAGSQIIAGEEAAQQSALVSSGAEVVAQDNVLRRLVDGADPSGKLLWPTDTEGFDMDNIWSARPLVSTTLRIAF